MFLCVNELQYHFVMFLGKNKKGILVRAQFFETEAMGPVTLGSGRYFGGSGYGDPDLHQASGRRQGAFNWGIPGIPCPWCRCFSGSPMDPMDSQ